jgi:ATP-dependent DNA helicase RecG
MNWERLQEMLFSGEGERVEFKTKIDPRAIGQSICAYLNSGGGIIVVGVGRNQEISGVPQGREIRQLERTIVEALSPAASVFFRERNLEDKPVWIIEVPEGMDMPYSFREEIFIREESGNRHADVDTIRDMIVRSQVEPERWERRRSDATAEKELDVEEIRRTLRDSALAHHITSRLSDTKSPVEALEKLGLIRYGCLTNAGYLLFATNPAPRLPQARVRAAWYSGGRSDTGCQDCKRFEGPLVQVLEQTFSFIRRNTPSRSPLTLSTHQGRDEQSLYPPEALREALVNAFVHRDYSDFSGAIAVDIYPGRMEIRNSGQLPDGVTPESLAKGNISILRNPDIARILYMRGMMAKQRHGCAVISNACNKYGLKSPIWHSDARSGVTLTLFAPEVTPEVSVISTPAVTPRVTPEVITILKALDSELTRRELQEKIGLKDAEHFRLHYLIPSLQSGFVEMTIPDKPNSRLQRYRRTALGKKQIKGGKR